MEDYGGTGGCHQPWGPTRLWTLVAGAGRSLFSAVFGPETPSSSSTSSSHSLDDAAHNFRDNEDTLVYLEEVEFVNWGGKQLEVVGESMEGSFALVSKIETKQAIEKLLMQETFSRDEFVRLVKKIESRVVEPSTNEVIEDGKQKELDNGASKSDYQRGCGCKSDSPDIQKRDIHESEEWLSENNTELRSEVNDLKRNFATVGSEEPIEETRRVRLKSVARNANSSNLKQFTLFPSVLENTAIFISPEANNAKPSNCRDEYIPECFATGLNEREENEEPKNISETVDRVSGQGHSCVLALPTWEHDKRRPRKCKGRARRGTNLSNINSRQS